MSYVTFGDAGDPVVLLMTDGTASPDPSVDAFAERLAAGPRFVIRYDGPSADAPDREAVGGALAALDACGIGSAHVVGGSAAARLAAEHPDRVESVAVLPPGADEAVRTSVAADVLRSSSGGWDEQGGRLAARAIATGDATGWFDRLYAAAAASEVDMPWDRDEPHPLLAEWARSHQVRGAGRRAVVVGCGLGADAEFLAGLGFETVGFDIAETAVRVAQERHQGTPVSYQVGDLLDLPREWVHAFDLVVDVFTVQALPDPPRAAAIVNVGRLVGPGGTLVVVAYRGDSTWDPPPWPLTREEVAAFATDGLDEVRVEEANDPRREHPARWRAEFHRAHGR
jgi:SAM-dependent methyltransferase